MGVSDDNGNFFKHSLKANAHLSQAAKENQTNAVCTEEYMRCECKQVVVREVIESHTSRQLCIFVMFPDVLKLEHAYRNCPAFHMGNLTPIKTKSLKKP